MDEYAKDEKVKALAGEAEDVPFYQEFFQANYVVPEEIEGVDDLPAVPIINSDDVLANQPPQTEDFRMRNDDAQTRRPSYTSGTTGNPKTIFKSYDEMDVIYDTVRRGHELWGMEEGDKAIDYFPFVGMNMSGFGTEGGMEALGIETVPISNTPFPPEREAEIILQHKPDDGNYVMMGLPSHIDSKGVGFTEAGYDPLDFGIDMVVMAGEPVTESRKEHIAELYDAEVYEYLGSTEGGAFAFECPESDGLHVLDDAVHVEVVDPDTGAPLPAGEQGSLAITPLIRPGDESSMPLLRYQLGDLVTMYEDRNCGCEMAERPRISPPRRESNDFILGAVNLRPSYFEDEIYAHPELKEAVSDYQLEVRYNPDAGQDILELNIATTEDDLVGLAAEAISTEMEPEHVAADLGESILENNQHLWDTVDNVGAARIDVRIVDENEIDTGQGKPQRLIDRRDP